MWKQSNIKIKYTLSQGTLFILDIQWSTDIFFKYILSIANCSMKCQWNWKAQNKSLFIIILYWHQKQTFNNKKETKLCKATISQFHFQSHAFCGALFHAALTKIPEKVFLAVFFAPSILVLFWGLQHMIQQSCLKFSVNKLQFV